MNLKNKPKYIHFPSVVGKGYRDYINFKGRYRICKGSRASKKSKTTVLDFVQKLIAHPEANLLVVRKTYSTLQSSVFTEFKWAVERLGVASHFKFNLQPLEITHIGTGQKIYFRGFDDPLKLTSITVSHGVLCWAYIEEAYEINSEADFNMLDESIRGEVPEGLFKQITLTFNPWNEHHWIKKRFFDAEDDPDIMAITTNYMCNEWLDEADKRVFDRMKLNNPRRYQVAGLGHWGITDGLVYENWREKEFNIEDVKHCITAVGMDFGYTNDESTLAVLFVDLENKKIYVWDEMYQKGLSNKKIFDNVVKMGYRKERITADSAEPKSIDELKGLGLRIQGAKKGQDSIMNGIQWIQDMEIIIHPRCEHFITEISNYGWKSDKFGNKLNTPIDDYNHLMDAMRYALEQYITKNKWLY